MNNYTVIEYLCDRGLLGADTIARIRVRDLSRRNHNLLIELDGRPVWFVKQVQFETTEVIQSLHVEAGCYQAAQDSPTLSGLRAIMPTCVLFDKENLVLVLEWIDGVNAAEAHLRVGPFDVRVAEVAGGLVGSLQNMTARALESSLPHLFPLQLPWVLRPAVRSHYCGERSRFLSLFMSDGRVARALSDLRDGWKPDTLVHGDTRQDNIMLCEPVRDSAIFQAKLIDWELADMGDAAWDCANSMQYYWAQWASINPPSLANWSALVSAVKGFWQAYINSRGLAPDAARILFDRVLSFTGVRLIQTAYEHFRSVGAWTGSVDRLARAACLLIIDSNHALQGFAQQGDGH